MKLSDTIKTYKIGTADDPKGPLGIGFCKHEEMQAPMLQIRGIGEHYNNFYKWYREHNIKPLWEHDDWPWHIVVLAPYDLVQVMRDWGPFMYYNGD